MTVVNLWAKSGHLSTPDGNSIYFWGFSDSEHGPAQLPGPHIVIRQGESVTVNLTNLLPEEVSIMFPGQPLVNVNGMPVTPQYQNGELLSFVNHASPNGGTISYTFIPDQPGTYRYESGTKPHKQVPLGLYGALVVRPVDYDHNISRTAYGPGTDTEFNREYVLILGEIDPDYHQAMKEGKPYPLQNYKPRYWTINGRCGNDAMMGDHMHELHHQPYGSMIKAVPGDKVLIRYINAGVGYYPLHPHGNHTRVIAQDGRLLRNGGFDLSYKRFTVFNCPGQTVDQIFEWTGLEYTPENPIPTLIPGIRNIMYGGEGMTTMWSGSPYLGEKKDIPPDIVSFNESGEYHFMLHSHSEPQITNWGSFPGGMMTMIAIYPDLPDDIGKLE